MIPLPTTVADVQHGLLTSRQLRDAGVTDTRVRRFVQASQLEQLAPRLYRIGGAPRTTAQTLLAAALDVGGPSGRAAVSHDTALAWWGVPGFTTRVIHVTRRRGNGQRRPTLAHHVHWVHRPPDDHTRWLEGVPVVTPARALFDLASLPDVWPAKVERAIDNAWSLRLVSGTTLHAMLDKLAARGKRGITLMRELLEVRRPDYVPPASGVERRFEEVLRRSAVRPLRRQVNSGDEDRWIGRVDFADPRVPLVVEVQSERFHTSLLDSQADKVRIDRLTAAGFVVIAVTDIDVWHYPDRVVRAVLDGRAAAERAITERTNNANRYTNSDTGAGVQLPERPSEQ